MDIEAYNRVLTQRGEDARKRSSGRLTIADIAFKKDLLSDKIVWYNQKKKDWHAFLKNYHPLYSICKAPKLHPFSRCERAVVFICNIGLAAILGIIVALIGLALEELWTEDWEEIVFNQSISILCGVIQSVVNGILKFLAVCPCFQKNSCPGCCRDIFECIGSMLILAWLALVCLLLAGFATLAWQVDIFLTFMLSFAASNVWSWISSFFILSICFNIKWKKEKKDETKLRKFKVTYMDYECCQDFQDVDGVQLSALPQARPQIKARTSSTVWKSTTSLKLYDETNVAVMDQAIAARNYKRDKPNRNDQDEVHDIFDKSTQEFKNQKARTKAAQEAWRYIKKAPDWKREIYILRQKHLGTDTAGLTTPVSAISDVGDDDVKVVEPATQYQPQSPSQPAPPSQSQPPSMKLVQSRSYDRDKPNNDDFKEIQDIFDKSSQNFKNKKERARAASKTWLELKKNPNWKQEIQNLRQQHLGTNAATPVRKSTDIEVVYGAQSLPSTTTIISMQSTESFYGADESRKGRSKPNMDDFKEIQDIFDNSSQEFKDKKARTRAASQAWKLLKKNPNWKQEIIDLRQKHLGTDGGYISSPLSRKSTDIDIVYGAESRPSSLILTQTQSQPSSPQAQIVYNPQPPSPVQAPAHPQLQTASSTQAIAARNYDRDKPNQDDFKEIQEIFDKSSKEFENKKARTRAASRAWKELKKNPNWKQEIADLRQQHLGTDGVSIISPPSRKSTDVEVVYGADSRPSSMISIQSQSPVTIQSQPSPPAQIVPAPLSPVQPPAEPQNDVLPQGWKSCTTPDGKVYYENETTNEIQWTKPAPQEEVLPEGWKKCATPDGKVYYQNDVTQETRWSKPEPVPQRDVLPEGWRKCATPDGKVYYQNDITQETRWTKPEPQPTIIQSIQHQMQTM